MNVRHLAAAVLAAGALAGTAAPASATCYVGDIDICNKPTDPYTDPVFAVVRDVTDDPALDPAYEVVGGVSQTVNDVVVTVMCTAGDYPYC